MKSHVSLEQHICVVCGKPFDTGAILLHRRLAQVLEHHTVTGNGLCPDDQKKFDDGYVALIAIDGEKSKLTNGIVKPQDAWRTGQIAHIKREAAARVFNIQIDSERSYVFCDPEVITRLEAMAKETEEKQ